jgi:hypothetical protein
VNKQISAGSKGMGSSSIGRLRTRHTSTVNIFSLFTVLGIRSINSLFAAQSSICQELKICLLLLKLIYHELLCTRAHRTRAAFTPMLTEHELLLHPCSPNTSCFAPMLTEYELLYTHSHRTQASLHPCPPNTSCFALMLTDGIYPLSYALSRQEWESPRPLENALAYLTVTLQFSLRLSPYTTYEKT